MDIGNTSGYGTTQQKRGHVPVTVLDTRTKCLSLWALHQMLCMTQVNIITAVTCL